MSASTTSAAAYKVEARHVIIRPLCAECTTRTKAEFRGSLVRPSLVGRRDKRCECGIDLHDHPEAVRFAATHQRQEDALRGKMLAAPIGVIANTLGVSRADALDFLGAAA